jgi:predicted metal-dependent phosphoesterase TrpH
MDSLYTDLHIHSKYSHDSLSSPESILKRAKKVGLERIAITDHGTIRGSIEAQKLAKKYDIEVIIASEIKTDHGDIIGIHLNEEINSFICQSVIKDIEKQGGISILPHPYREHPLPINDIAQLVNFIEIWNSRCSYQQNRDASLLACDTKKDIMCGSDAHCLAEIGLVKVKTDRKDYTMKIPHTLQQARIWNVKKSRIIALGKRNIHKLIFKRHSFI